jgi:hypothetical protein
VRVRMDHRRFSWRSIGDAVRLHGGHADVVKADLPNYLARSSGMRTSQPPGGENEQAR